MSWSVNVIGRAPAAAIAAASAFAACKGECPADDAALKSAAATVASVLACYPADFAVRVEASGSCDPKNPKAPPYIMQQSLAITPVYNFVV